MKDLENQIKLTPTIVGKRAYRRYKKETLLKKRAKRNYYWLGYSMEDTVAMNSWADFWKEIKTGKKCIWMRNTGVACSCYGCSGYFKYKRPSKSEEYKLIWNHYEMN